MKESMLRKYAKLIIKVGANLKKNQKAIIYVDVENAEFAKYVVEEAYKAGASEVAIEWTDQNLTKLHYKYQSEESLAAVLPWQEEKMKQRVKDLPAMIHLISSDPDGLKGIDQEKVKKVKIAQYPYIKKYIEPIENMYQWTIAAVPGKMWAKKVFPNVSEKKAIYLLWDAILTTSRVKGKTQKNWKEHNEHLLQKCELLNEYHFKYLKYKSNNGTDIKIGLNPNNIWLGGGEKTLNGRFFNPNIPTEECFGMPMRDDVNGIVYSSKPLSYAGELIEDFSLKFENGKVVEVHAQKNEELLKKLVSMDEGASYLGEVALVPYDSPISQSGILFYETLFDENASCHLALGKGFANNFKNYENLSYEQMKKMGLNESIIHVDFMIGTKDLEIIGIDYNNKEICIFKDGNWEI